MRQHAHRTLSAGCRQCEEGAPPLPVGTCGVCRRVLPLNVTPHGTPGGVLPWHHADGTMPRPGHAMGSTEACDGTWTLPVEAGHFAAQGVHAVASPPGASGASAGAPVGTADSGQGAGTCISCGYPHDGRHDVGCPGRDAGRLSICGEPAPGRDIVCTLPVGHLAQHQHDGERWPGRTQADVTRHLEVQCPRCTGSHVYVEVTLTGTQRERKDRPGEWRAWAAYAGDCHCGARLSVRVEVLP